MQYASRQVTTLMPVLHFYDHDTPQNNSRCWHTRPAPTHPRFPRRHACYQATRSQTTLCWHEHDTLADSCQLWYSIPVLYYQSWQRQYPSHSVTMLLRSQFQYDRYTSECCDLSPRSILVLCHHCPLTLCVGYRVTTPL